MNKEKLILFFIFLLIFPTLLLLWFIHFRGFISYDDGWFLQDGLRLLQGEKIYKDFHYLYNPGSLYINALAFKLFGISIFASRIMAMVNSCIAILLLILICKKVKLSYLLSSMLISSYIVWGPAHVNFVWPVMFCLTLAVAIGTLFLYNSKERNTLFLVLIGILSACIFILKQNFGVAIIVSTFVYLLYDRTYKNVTSFVYYTAGYSIIIFLQLVYFISTNTLTSYFQEFYDYTVVKIVQQGILNSDLPWEYPAPFLYQILKLFLYISPLIICLISGFILYKKKQPTQLLYFPLVGISFYLLSIRPTTDYIHLTPLISISLIPLIFIYQQSKNLRIKILWILLLCICLLGGFYSAFFRNYYRWNTPLLKQKAYMNHPTLKIFTDDKEKTSITELVNYYEKNAKNEKYTFIYYFTPIYYLILDKKNPTSYDDLQLGGVSDRDQKQIVTILQNKKVNHIITDVDISADKSIIALFIKTNYIPVKKVNEYTIWRSKLP